MDYRLILIILGFVLVILPLLLFVFCKNEKIVKNVFSILALFYFLLIIIGVFFNIQLGKKIFILPFQKIENLDKRFDFSLLSRDILDFIINICMFIPLAFLLYPLFKSRPILKTIIFCTSLTITIEIMQLILPISRSPQLLDIIVNVLSCFIGIAFYKLLEILIKNRKNWFWCPCETKKQHNCWFFIVNIK